MKQFFVLLWILWFNLTFMFGITSIYFVRLADWRAFITVPLLALVLFWGWRLVGRTRREWRESREQGLEARG